MWKINYTNVRKHSCYLSRLFQYHTTTSYSHTHAHPFNGPISGWASTRKVKPSLILLQQETVSGSGISWAIRKSAPSSRQVTMPAPHHSVFLQAGCPSCHPTNSVKALKANTSYSCKLIMQKNDANLFPSVLWYTIGWVSGRVPSPQKLSHLSP